MRDRWEIVPPRHHERRLWVAAMICHRFRLLRAEQGTLAAARRLRKYGFPLPLALRVLGITPTLGLPAAPAAAHNA
jgi:hypothetical protein